MAPVPRQRWRNNGPRPRSESGLIARVGLFGLFGLALVTVACRSKSQTVPASQDAESAASATVTLDASAQRTSASPVLPMKAGERIRIPAGRFIAGSLPGDEGRDPIVEPVAYQVSMNAFEIDALAFPNDPKEPPKTGVSLSEAERLCKGQGGRLCTELEWEYACQRAESANGVDGPSKMGALREWTSSELLHKDSEARSHVVRGARAEERLEDKPRRCARRTPMREANPDLGFRCCAGPENSEKIPAIERKPTFREARMGEAELGKIIESIPELSKISRDVKLFDPNDGTYLVRSTAPRESREGIVFTLKPILYSPESGSEYLVATGRSKATSFIVALHVLPDDRYRVASAFYIQGEVAPIALAYRPQEISLRWTTCWECLGEMGKVSVRPDHRVVIVQD